LPELEGPGSWFLVGSSTGIGTRHQSDSRDGHLGIQRAFDLVIARLLQGKRSQWLASMIAGFREGVLHVSKRLYRALQVGICLDHDGDGSLNVHTIILPLTTTIINNVWTYGASLPCLKAGTSAPHLGGNMTLRATLYKTLWGFFSISVGTSER